jgi:ActR/RegA family two-component response regulator
MKVLIFENQFDQLRIIFEAVKLLYFNGAMTFKELVSSQEMGDLTEAKAYDFIFVDIDLSKKSTLDGFQIIEKLISLGYPKNKISVLTGWVNISEELKKRGITDIQTVTKPPSIDAVYKAIKRGNP